MEREGERVNESEREGERGRERERDRARGREREREGERGGYLPPRRCSHSPGNPSNFTGSTSVRSCLRFRVQGVWFRVWEFVI